MNRTAKFAVLVALLTTPAGAAYAAEPPEWTEAAKLLDEGRVLMSKPSTLDQGCLVLEKSHSLRQRGDTLLNLAECHRRQGKTATAWREFDEAIRYAKEAEFGEAIRTAEVHRNELAKTLSELVIEVPPQPERPEGLTVTLDGKPLPEQQWGQTLYVDPGTHQVAATAPNHHAFSGSAVVEITGNRSMVIVRLTPLPEPPKPKPPAPTPPPRPPVVDPELPLWAIVVGAAGVSSMGVSIAFIVDSNAAGAELDAMCGGKRRDECPADYAFGDAYDREVRSFGVFVGLGAAGLVAAGVGAFGLAFGLAAEPSPVALLPWMDPDGGGATFSGRF